MAGTSSQEDPGSAPQPVLGGRSANQPRGHALGGHRNAQMSKTTMRCALAAIASATTRWLGSVRYESRAAGLWKVMTKP